MEKTTQRSSLAATPGNAFGLQAKGMPTDTDYRDNPQTRFRTFYGRQARRLTSRATVRKDTPVPQTQTAAFWTAVAPQVRIVASGRSATPHDAQSHESHAEEGNARDRVL
jgi:hypothetical protein